MAKVLVLGRQGSGKSTSLIGISELGIKGLNPQETFLISCVNKPLPARGSGKKFIPIPMEGVTPETLIKHIAKGNRLITKDAKMVAKAIELLISSPFKNIVIDDLNYLSQDYYMKNALKQGWDVPKNIGYNMGLIFDQIDSIPEEGKNIICMAHFDSYKDKNDGSMVFKYKSTGNMVDEYLTPEGKFETVLFSVIDWNDSTKVAERKFITNNDGTYPAKSPYGMFKELQVPNDLGLILDTAETYFKGE